MHWRQQFVKRKKRAAWKPIRNDREKRARQSSTAASLSLILSFTLCERFFFSCCETRHCCGRSLESLSFFSTPISIRLPVLVYLILSCHCDNFYYYIFFFRSVFFRLSWIRALNISTMLMCLFHTPHTKNTHIHSWCLCVSVSMRCKVMCVFDQF